MGSAVYRAVNTAEKHEPDELKFSFEQNPDSEFPSQHWDQDEIEHIIIRSPEMGLTIRLNISFQNNTGIREAWARIPAAKFSEKMKNYYEQLGRKPEKLELGSNLWVVTDKFDAFHVPTRRDKAPVLVMFPDFRPWMHSSNDGLVSAGIRWGVFRFARCEQAAEK